MPSVPRDETFADLLAANEAYAGEFGLAGLPARAARGLAVLTCIDSRIEPLAMLGLAPGDAKILRNAGARVTDDVLRTLVLASYLLGVDRVMVVAHTKCRMAAGGEEDVHEAVTAAGGPDTRSLAFLVTARPGGDPPRRRPARALLAVPRAPARRRVPLRRRHRPSSAASATEGFTKKERGVTRPPRAPLLCF